MTRREFASPLLQDLDRRGCILSCSDLDGLDAVLASGERIAVYEGFDPTARDLHAGHLLPLAVLRRFALAGHHVVPVVGTATALVGDPSGRSAARPLLDEATMRENARGVSLAIAAGIGAVAGSNGPAVAENGDWFAGLGWIGFLRDVGSLVPVGRVLGLESVRERIGEAGSGAGMSFLEFSYALMQGFDFLHLHRQHGTLLQLGGSDQWGNVCMGLDIIARTGARERAAGGDGASGRAFGLTHPLMTRSDGEKMGKSAGNAVWLRAASGVSDFEFFRFWRTVDDADVLRLALALSDRGVEELESLAGNIDALKESLAAEMTARVRGEKAALLCEEASRGRGRVAAGLPEFAVSSAELGDLPAILVRAGLAESKGAARRLAAGGGVRVGGSRHAGDALLASDFHDGVAVVSAGRTRHAALRLAG